MVWGSYTFQKLSFLAPEFFHRCKMFLQRKNFNRQFLAVLAVFFVWNVSPHKKNVCQRSYLLVNAEPRCYGHFRSKIEVKSSKSFCRGNFLFVPFNPLFYVWTMRQYFKNIPAKFQSRPTFLAGFFSKRVTDDDDRRKTLFLASCSEYCSLIYRVVTMEYRTSDRGNAVSPHSASFLQLSFNQQIPWFFLVLLELRTFVPDHLVAIRLFF